ncbi:MAG: type III-B CRISPR module RAMP protein Cmr6 [bacterium]
MSTRREQLETIKVNQCIEPHTGLWLDKFISNQEKGKVRNDFIAEVATISIPNFYGLFFNRWQTMLADYKCAGYAAQSREATVSGRIVIGIGNESILETAVTLHRTYGVPYIPGSALKGLAANFARHYCGADWKQESENYKIVFGTTTQEGCVVFFDGLYKPDSGFAGRPLHPDVMTVHHQDYYMEANIPPADWDDPKPIPFLSVTGTYLLALAASKGGEQWLEASFDILKPALKELGIGAKTSSGYGRMDLVP